MGLLFSEASSSSPSSVGDAGGASSPPPPMVGTAPKPSSEPKDAFKEIAWSPSFSPDEDSATRGASAGGDTSGGDTASGGEGTAGSSPPPTTDALAPLEVTEKLIAIASALGAVTARSDRFESRAARAGRTDEKSLAWVSKKFTWILWKVSRTCRIRSCHSTRNRSTSRSNRVVTRSLWFRLSAIWSSQWRSSDSTRKYRSDSRFPPCFIRSSCLLRFLPSCDNWVYAYNAALRLARASCRAETSMSRSSTGFSKCCCPKATWSSIRLLEFAQTLPILW
mmetsp:Transcript_30434/g.65310  ORF Transcript_30434/g.65310 Transcript_30434/m.65310 type:complete len:279 (+) Transcript_30434:1041-1877(+)